MGSYLKNRSLIWGWIGITRRFNDRTADAEFLEWWDLQGILDEYNTVECHVLFVNSIVTYTIK